MTRRMAMGLMLLVAVLGLAACDGEPVIVSTQLPPPTVVTERGFPEAPPDMAQGAAIFAARCTECHGVNGAGDGVRVQTGQLANVPNFLDPEVPGAQRVSEWYDVITNGRIENLMPPWRSALSEEERWAVTYYSYTMHASAEQIARGAEIYAESCAGCHGEGGRGDGPDAARLSGSVGDLTDQANMVSLSDAAIHTTIREGVGDPNDGMPAFGDELNDADIRAVTSFVRTLALENTAAVAAAATTAPAQDVTEEAVAPATEAATLAPTAIATLAETTAAAQPVATEEPMAGPTFTISGTISHGTAGGSVPEGLELSLFVFPPEADPIELEGTSGPGGAFSFSDVLFMEDAAYAITVTYQDRLFLSGIAPGNVLEAEPTLNVTIYELTDDPSVLTISLIETQINVASNRLEVAQFIEVTNSSDRAFSTSELTEDGRPVSLSITLPPGSVVPGFSAPGRYVFLADSFTVQDTQPVYPGRIHLVQIVYLIPYENSAIIEQPLNYAFDGLDQLLVRPTGVDVNAEGLSSMGTTTLGGLEFMSFNGTRTLPAGSVLRVELSGNPGAPASAATMVSSDVAVLLLVGGGVVLGVLVALFVWSRRRGAPSAPAAAPKGTVEALARQIAELDAAYAAGEVPEDSYKKQRAGLKARLTNALIGDDGP
jgi:mono/diheme cytochrome c family protein